jgi:methionyl-tRNA synthetase
MNCVILYGTMKRNNHIRDEEISQLFDEECARYFPSKPISVCRGAVTCIDHDSCTDEEDEALCYSFYSGCSPD